MPNIHYDHCPVCGSTIFNPVFKAKDYTVSQQEFQIVHCESCTLRFTQDVPDINEIGAYYKSENYISHTNTSKGFINTLYQKVRVRTMKQKAGIIKSFTGLQTGKLLDIGCGTGTFLHTMKQHGWQVKGLEPDADARQVCASTYKIETAPSGDLFALEQNSFDAITLWHVLEHIHPLQDYVEQITKLLKPNGKLFIAVPNYTSKDAKAYGKYWAGYDVPRHLYHFSPKAMETLLQQHQLRMVKLLPMWFDSFYVDILSSKYKSGSTNYLSAGLHGLASNLHAVGNVSACCSIIYVVEKA